MLNINKNLLNKILDTALEKGGDFAEIFWEETVSNRFRLEKGKVEEGAVGLNKGVGIRVIIDEITGYAYTDELLPETIIKTAKIASSIAKQAKKKFSQSVSSVKKSSLNFPINIRPEDVLLKSKIDLGKRIYNKASNYSKEIINVIVAYNDYLQNVCITNSDGLLVYDERVYTRLITQVIASRENIVQIGMAGSGGFCGMELYDKYTPESIAEKASETAIKMLSAKPIKAGTMPVILTHGPGGVLFHEACGHGLEADHIQKSSSIYSGKINTQVASSQITLVDDGTIIGKQGSFRFDDEGTPSNKNVLIENGILKKYMYDYLTAKHDKTVSTGNGRRQSYQHLPVPRMTNTYIENGNYSSDEIIESTKNGIFVKSLGGGMVNVVSGDFVFNITEGYLIENGKISYPIRGANLIGNGPKILQSIDMIGNDLKLDDGIGTCSKGQSVAVAVGQPTLRIPEITVGGTE